MLQEVLRLIAECKFLLTVVRGVEAWNLLRYVYEDIRSNEEVTFSTMQKVTDFFDGVPLEDILYYNVIKMRGE